jgi:ribose transport system ATP-binding protein
MDVKKNNFLKLRMEKITKAFPGVQALDKIDFELEGGVVHAIVGENGAGKSTLIKILAGVYKKDSGEIYINDEKIEVLTPLFAKKIGISVIYQEFSLIPELDISHNIFLGKEKNKHIRFFVDKKTMHKKTKDILEKLNIYIDPRTKVGDLTVGEQQLVEIAKAIISDARIIVMDEPTSALSEEEKLKLFDIIRRLKTEGIGIIYITHRMKEIFEIADYVTIMRDGLKVGRFRIKDTNENTVIKLMVGRELGSIYKRERTNKKGENVLRVENLTKKGVFNNISFYVRKGEVLGISGLMGAGRTEVVRCIFGLDKFDSGKIFFMNHEVRFNHPFDAIKEGIGFVPEDRKRLGIIPFLDVKKNIALPSLYWISNISGWIDSNKELKLANEFSKKLNIIMSSLEQQVCYLSGGNQQKVVLAKWLARDPKLLILDEPTRGIDVGAKSEIHKLISTMVNNNIAVIMISSELPEILGVSDRIVVMHEGNLVTEFDHTKANEENLIMAAATGHS